MIRVLVVDDEEHWRSIIAGALPEPDYRVDPAASYSDALDLLLKGIPYDAAIVDLNLVEDDELGKVFLGRLRDTHPAVPRIVVTGANLDEVVDFVNEYGLAKLFLKRSLRVAQVREAVKKELMASDLPMELRAERGDRWDEFSEWRDSQRHHIDRNTKRLESDRRNADRNTEAPREAKDAVAALTAAKAAFEKDCSAVAAMLASIHDQADLDAATGAFTTLQDKYEGAF